MDYLWLGNFVANILFYLFIILAWWAASIWMHNRKIKQIEEKERWLKSGSTDKLPKITCETAPIKQSAEDADKLPNTGKASVLPDSTTAPNATRRRKNTGRGQDNEHF